MLTLAEQYSLALDAGNFDRLGEILAIASRDVILEDAILEGHKGLDYHSDVPFVQQIQREVLNAKE
jgi:hypothetical protein